MSAQHESGDLSGQSYPEFSYVGDAGHYMVFTTDDGEHAGADVCSDGPGRWFVWPGDAGHPYPTREAAARASWEAGRDG